jgi:3-oxoacyl-[acyl-carrier-protein] synthase II
MTRPEIAITGCGMLTALGGNVVTTWSRLLAGESGIQPWPHSACLPTQQAFAGAVVGADTPQRGHDRYTHLALQAAREAIHDAGFLHRPFPEGLRVGIVVGCSTVGLATLIHTSERFAAEGLRGVPPETLPMIMSNSAGAAIGQWCGATGPTWTVNTGCASGADAIGLGARMLERGEVDLVIAGGAETPLVPWGFAGLAALRVLAAWDGAPADASRPCDTHRTGLVLSEGAAMVVLERTHDVRDREVQARIHGYAATTDLAHGTFSTATSIAECLQLALLDAGCGPDDIDAFDLHATGTRRGDPAEAQALLWTCGSRADTLPAVASKAALGHALAAAGAIEVVLAVQNLRGQVLPPTRNWQDPDPGCLHGLSLVPRLLPLRRVLKVSMGIGGHNACLILAKGENR